VWLPQLDPPAAELPGPGVSREGWRPADQPVALPPGVGRSG
jgi:hypothetical protein